MSKHKDILTFKSKGGPVGGESHPPAPAATNMPAEPIDQAHLQTAPDTTPPPHLTPYADSVASPQSAAMSGADTAATTENPPATVTRQTGDTILDWLVKTYPQAKRGTLRRMIQDHAVELNGKPVRSLKQPIKASDRPIVGAAKQKQPPFRGGLKILHQDADILIIRKPAGLLTATTEEEPRPTVLALLQERIARKNQKMQVHLVHRLDRDASGLLVLACGIRPLANLKMQFRRHTITREYELIVHGLPRPATGKLEHRLLEVPGGRVAVCGPTEGKAALLDYQVLETRGKRSLVRCRLFTGRKHQIRVQFSAIGHPLVGDKVYGTLAGRQGGEGRLALHAIRLSFRHPRSNRELDFTSSLPDTIRVQLGK